MANGVGLPCHGHVHPVPRNQDPWVLIISRHSKPVHWHLFPGAGLGTHRSIDSGCGMVLAPEVHPGPHQIYTAKGT